MKIEKAKLEKLENLLKSFEQKNGTVAVRDKETVNACTDCYINGGCRGNCQSTCKGGAAW